MTLLPKIKSWVQAIFTKRQLDLEMDEEMRAHIEMRTQANLAAGMNANDAWRAAMQEFGWPDTIKETCRDQRGVSWVENVVRDIRFACRQLGKNPGFTCVAVLTLGLCIGANLSIFAVVDAILIRPLPFPDSDRLVTLYNSYPKANIPRCGESLPSYYQRRTQIPAFSSLAIISETTSIVGESGSTSRENFGRVTPEFFATLGVTPSLGRAFKEEEMTYRTDHEALLSYEYWHSQYDADPDILGKTIRMDGITRVIVGVLPKGFQVLSFIAPIYGPCSSDPDERSAPARHSNTDKIEIGRLAPGATLVQAQSQVDANNNAHAAEFPQAQEVADTGFRTLVAPLRSDHVASVRPILVLLQAGGVFLLLIGGVNLANLLLIRASSRTRELGIRQSLGATRRHVVSQVMSETALLALAGGALGVGAGAAGIRLLATLGVNQIPLGSTVVFNWRLALATLAVALALGMAIAIPVAWFNLRGHLANALRTDSRTGTASRDAQRLRHTFIVAQISLAFLLLSGAGLLTLSLKRAMEVSPGCRVDHILTGQFGLPWQGYHDLNSFVVFFDRLYNEVSHEPGVSAAGAVSGMPLSGGDQTQVVTVPGYVDSPGESVLVHDFLAVGGDYFAAMGIPLRDGRYLNQADTHAAQKNCVVDEDFARHYWPNGRALGKQVYSGRPIDPKDTPFIVVGVVGAVKQISLTDKMAKGAIYVPYNLTFSRNYYLVVRTAVEPQAVAGEMRKVIRQIDPEIPLNDIRTMNARIEDSLVTRRSPALLASIFALAALLLAAIGSYGVLSYAVAQRRREIAVRMALGARRQQVLAQFVKVGAKLLVTGVAAGAFGAWAVGRAMQNVLFGVGAMDAEVLGVAGLVLTFVVLFAIFIPSRRAARLEPMEALRCE